MKGYSIHATALMKAVWDNNKQVGVAVCQWTLTEIHSQWAKSAVTYLTHHALGNLASTWQRVHHHSLFPALCCTDQLFCQSPSIAQDTPLGPTFASLALMHLRRLSPGFSGKCDNVYQTFKDTFCLTYQLTSRTPSQGFKVLTCKDMLHCCLEYIKKWEHKTVIMVHK